MKYFITFTLIVALWGSFAHAQEIEIAVPNGWTASESGIVKGNSELLVGPTLDIGESSLADYLRRLAKVPVDGLEIKSIAEPKDGNIVAQVLRNVVKDGTEARSIYFICKGGKNKHRLLELFTDDVFVVISGGKAAIDFCSQS